MGDFMGIEIYIYIMIFIFGSVMGSFLNVLFYGLVVIVIIVIIDLDGMNLYQLFLI